MVVSATKNTSPVQFGFAERFGNLATQQQAKDMSKQHLDSKAGGKATVYDTDINYIKELAGYFGNQANQTYNERYEKQLKDAMYNQQQAASDKISTDRTAFERQMQLNQQNFNNQMSLANSVSRSSGSGGSGGNGNYSSSSTAFGMNAPTPSGYSFNYLGMRGLYDGSAVANFNSQQANTAMNNRLFSEANAAGDIARDKAQMQNQAYLTSINQRNQIDMMNRQTSIDAQRSANDYARQSQESSAERASKERQTAINAQSNMYSAMFSSFRSNPGDYQYWGGKV